MNKINSLTNRLIALTLSIVMVLSMVLVPGVAGQIQKTASVVYTNSQETSHTVLQENVVRVKGDIDWFCGMFDYRQAGKDWKNSRDAVSRGMQKLRGIYPADPPYKQDT